MSEKRTRVCMYCAVQSGATRCLVCGAPALGPSCSIKTITIVGHAKHLSFSLTTTAARFVSHTQYTTGLPAPYGYGSADRDGRRKGHGLSPPRS